MEQFINDTVHSGFVFISLSSFFRLLFFFGIIIEKRERKQRKNSEVLFG
jgi:hypothetical protein